MRKKIKTFKFKIPMSKKDVNLFKHITKTEKGYIIEFLEK